MCSYIYIKFDRELNGETWTSLKDARHYTKFRKEVFNTCRQKKLPTLEDFFVQDDDDMLERELLDVPDWENDLVVEEWFYPAEAIVVVRALRDSFANRKEVPFRALFQNFLEDLLVKLTQAQEQGARFRLEFNGSV